MGFGDSGRRVPGPGNIRYALSHHRPQTVQVDQLPVLLAGAEGAGGRHHRIPQFYAGQIDCRIYFYISFFAFFYFYVFFRFRIFFYVHTHIDFPAHLQLHLLCTKYRAVLTDPFIMYIGMGIHLFRLTDAGQTGADAAGHPFFQRNPCFQILLCRKALNPLQHRRRPAGIDHVRPDPILPDSVQHISFCPLAAVLGSHSHRAASLKGFLHKHLIPVAQHDLFPAFQLFRQFQKRENPDAAAYN